MTLQEIYDHYHRNWNFAMRELGMSPTGYIRWLRAKCIPISTQRKIEAVTQGALKADISHGVSGGAGEVDKNWRKE